MKRSYTLQYLRACAALTVILYHASHYLSLIRAEPQFLKVFSGSWSAFGVTTFFVLSGYLMARLSLVYDARRFVLHRLARIYPMYWLCVALAAALYVKVWQLTLPTPSYVPAIGQMLAPDGLFPNSLRLALLPLGFPDYPLGIEWTLLYEVTFFLFVGVLILLGIARHLPAICLAWLALIVGAHLVNPNIELQSYQPTLLTLPFLGPNIGFIFGALMAALAGRIRVHPSLPIIAGVSLFVAYQFLVTPYTFVALSSGVALVIFGLLLAEEATGTLKVRPLAALGDWSYALYLFHVPVIVAVMKLAPLTWSPLAVWSLAILLPILSCAILGPVDLWIYRKLKGLIDGRVRLPSAPTRSASLGE